MVARPQRLRDGGVLGVDGDDLAGPRGARDQLTSDDQALLVRQREGRPGVERGERGGETDRPGDPVEDDVGGGVAHESDGLVDPERRAVDAERRRLRREAGGVAAGRQAHHLEPVPVRGDHLERLRADRTGRTEDQDAAHATEPNARSRYLIARIWITNSSVCPPSGFVSLTSGP